MSVKAYLQSLEKEHRTGIAQEHAYRPALKDLVEASLANVTAVNDSKQIECGAPDFILTEEQSKVDLGYIEAKDLQIALDKAEQTDQMERYRAALDNLILTNYLEFRFYRLGEAIDPPIFQKISPKKTAENQKSQGFQDKEKGCPVA